MERCSVWWGKEPGLGVPSLATLEHEHADLVLSVQGEDRCRRLFMCLRRRDGQQETFDGFHGVLLLDALQHWHGDHGG